VYGFLVSVDKMQSTDSLFLLTTTVMIPLFIYIIMGYVGGKVLKLDRETIAKLLFYLINPIAIFHNLVHTKVEHTLFLIPIIFFAISCLICLIFYYLSKKIWDNEIKNIIAYSAGTGNVGYMLFPIVTAIFGQEYSVPFFFIVVGVSLYENSLGFYISAAGKYTARNSFIKLIKLPTLYAFILGIIFNYFGTQVHPIFTKFTSNVSNLYTVIGMMIIGLSLAATKSFKIDFKFLGMMTLARYVVWPAVTIGLVIIDQKITHLYSHDLHQLFMVATFIPLAVTSLVIATIFNIHPEKVAVSVMLTTVTAIIYIPLIIKFILTYGTAL
jgi:predicted permease